MESPQAQSLIQPNAEEKPVSSIPENISAPTLDEVRKTNPYGVNQYTAPDPRQALFLSLYLDPQSPTFSNCYRSALQAGYEEAYAKNLLDKAPKWLVEYVDTAPVIQLAEKNLRKYLGMSTETPAYTMWGKPILNPDGSPVMRDLNKRLEVQADLTKFALERLDPKKYGKTDKVVGTHHILFSLSDLRRAEQEEKAREAQFSQK